MLISELSNNSAGHFTSLTKAVLHREIILLVPTKFILNSSIDLSFKTTGFNGIYFGKIQLPNSKSKMASN